MTSKLELRQTLKALDYEFATNLPLHLYSAFLLHRINPRFPKRAWSTWPKRFEEVPIPDTKFEDDVIDPYDSGIYEHDISFDEDMNKYLLAEHDRLTNKGLKILKNKSFLSKSNNIRKRGEQNDSQDDDDYDDDDHHHNHDNNNETTGIKPVENESIYVEESDDDEEEYRTEKKQPGNNASGEPVAHGQNLTEEEMKRRVVDIVYHETAPNAKSVLVNAIHGLIESKIQQKIQKMKEKGKIDKSLYMTDELPHQTLIPICSQIAGRFDQVLNTLFRTYTPRVQKQMRLTLIEWQHVVSAAVANAISRPNVETVSLVPLENVFQQCKFLFDGEGVSANEYQFEDSVDQKAVSKVFDENGGFNVVEYLKYLGSQNIPLQGPLTYTDLAEQHMDYTNAEIERKTKLETNILNALKLVKESNRVAHNDDDEEIEDLEDVYTI